MPQNNKKIRVAILGDGKPLKSTLYLNFSNFSEKVGKTSLITTLISESLPEKV